MAFHPRSHSLIGIPINHPSVQKNVISIPFLSIHLSILITTRLKIRRVIHSTSISHKTLDGVSIRENEK